MSSNAADLIRVARDEVGYQEGRSGSHWNNIQKYSPAVPGLGGPRARPGARRSSPGAPGSPATPGCSR